jgi:hypothetical protein
MSYVKIFKILHFKAPLWFRFERFYVVNCVTRKVVIAFCEVTCAFGLCLLFLSSLMIVIGPPITIC